MSNVDPEEAAAARGEGVELIPAVTPDELGGIAEPGGPTLERLWQLSGYDPRFYRGLVAAAGYVRPAWLAQATPPAPIKPWIPPRPVPAYVGLSTSVGIFETDLSTPEFGSAPPGSGF